MISSICDRYGITNYTINDDGSIDVNGNVYLSNKYLTELPLTFNKVTGSFYCNNNQLTSLKGSPRWVGDYFSCSYNRLTSLEFSPDYVGGVFNCRANNLTNNISDSEVGGKFHTDLKQEGMLYVNKGVINYNEWRKLYKRRQILENIFSKKLDI